MFINWSSRNYDEEILCASIDKDYVIGVEVFILAIFEICSRLKKPPKIS
jgi:hypothetical protein